MIRKTLPAVFLIASAVFIAPASGDGFEPGLGFVFVVPNNEHNSGIGAQVNGDLIANDKFTFRGIIGGYQAGTKSDGQLPPGDYRQIFFEANGLATFPSNNLRPYIGGGLGYYVSDVVQSDSFKAQLEEEGRFRTDEFDNIFGFNIRGGFLFHASPKVWTGLDAKFTTLNPTLTTKTDDGTRTSKPGLGTLSLTLFINWRI